MRSMFFGGGGGTLKSGVSQQVYEDVAITQEP